VSEVLQGAASVSASVVAVAQVLGSAVVALALAVAALALVVAEEPVSELVAMVAALVRPPLVVRWVAQVVMAASAVPE
jgi:hypothetical protein